MMSVVRRVAGVLLCVAVLSGLAWASEDRQAPRQKREWPRLVLWITVDQLRGDLLGRYLAPSAKGGLAYCRDHGIWYTQAHYPYATTFTAVGHATLFTGGLPADHGIVGNDWCDLALGRTADSVQDDDHPLIGQKAAPGKGYSPLQLTSSTVGDELILASGGRARVFSVSTKDRGAILPGGRLGKAFWYEKGTGQYVTSEYYYKEYPAWVTQWNASRPADKFRDAVWRLQDAPDTYLHRDHDDRPCERGYKYLGRTFPHAMATEKVADFYAALPYSPFSDELTVAFARTAVEQEQLGRGPATDMLAMSLSATDPIGHGWGPESLEAEDNVRRVDVLLGEFLRFIDERIGLDKTLLLLAADHGMDDVPECARATGLPAGRHDPARFIRQINDALRIRYGIDRDLVISFWNPSLYLDLKALDELKLDRTAVERATADEVLRIPGFAFAATRTDLLVGGVPDSDLGRKLLNSFHPTRTGNVLIAPAPFWFLYPDPDYGAAMHGSPHAYDTHVPVMVAGPGLRPRRVHRRVSPNDLARTVCDYLAIKPPSGCSGDTLVEVLNAAGSMPDRP